MTTMQTKRFMLAYIGLAALIFGALVESYIAAVAGWCWMSFWLVLWLWLRRDRQEEKPRPLFDASDKVFWPWVMWHFWTGR